LNVATPLTRVSVVVPERVLLPGVIGNCDGDGRFAALVTRLTEWNPDLPLELTEDRHSRTALLGLKS